MKYSLVELLQCPKCQAGLEVAGAEHREREGSSVHTFSCQRYCGLERRSGIPGTETCAECGRTEIVSGVLACLGCSQKFRIVNGVPWLFDEQVYQSDCRLSNTARLYGHLWGCEATTPSGSSHVEQVEEALGEPIVQGGIGLDAGSGSGADTAVMARRHPLVQILSLDLSEGVYTTKRYTESLPNVHVIRGSLLDIPVRSEGCDFAYSFGVLHHTPDPLRGAGEIARVLKNNGILSLYLYEDHADNPWKRIPLKIVSILRRATVRFNPSVLSGLCYVVSPLVVLFFSFPARIFRQFNQSRTLADKMPFNFGSSLWSVHADLLDRFGAPIEIRYSRESMTALLATNGFSRIKITKRSSSAGWVAIGLKASTQESGVQAG